MSEDFETTTYRTSEREESVFVNPDKITHLVSDVPLESFISRTSFWEPTAQLRLSSPPAGVEGETYFEQCWFEHGTGKREWRRIETVEREEP